MGSASASGLARAGAVAALVAATGMASAYQGNQNTYLLHAVAARGGPLELDRLVRSPDPTPVFTAIARGALNVADGPAGLYVLWVLAAATFFGALVWAASPLIGTNRALIGWTAIVAVLAGPLVGKGIEAVTDDRASGLTGSGSLLGGVAEQYALGQYLQPSAAGVLLVLAVVATVRHRDRPLWVATLFAAGAIHPTYLVTGWVLAGGLALAWMLEAAGWRDRFRVVAQVGAVGIVASVPGVVLNWSAVRAVQGPDAAAANAILANERLPHHANPGTWFDPATALLLLVVIAILLSARRHEDTRIRDLSTGLLGVAGVSAVLTACAQLADDAGILLLFPWRASIIVVPLAFALGAGLIVERSRGASELVAVGALVVVVALAVAGLARTANDLSDPLTDDPLIAVIRANPPRGEGLVPIDQEDLRLNAGYSVFADFKSHPFQPAAVTAWWDRVDRARRAQQSERALCAEVERSNAGWVVTTDALATAAGSTCLGDWQRFDVAPYAYLRQR